VSRATDRLVKSQPCSIEAYEASLLVSARRGTGLRAFTHILKASLRISICRPRHGAQISESRLTKLLMRAASGTSGQTTDHRQT
jgi:hypothetical protein